MTWIGHATVLVQMGGLNVLTDPLFSEYASPRFFVGLGAKAWFAARAAAGLPEDAFFVLRHGETRRLARN